MKLRMFLTSVLCLALCAFLGGCLTAADYEDIYNDDARIATCSTNVMVGSVKSGIGSEYKWSCSSFSGVYPIKDVKSSADVNLSLNIESGKFKIVAVNGNDVYTLAEGGFDGKVDFSKMPSGSYTIKAVGVEAEFSLKLTY